MFDDKEIEFISNELKTKGVIAENASEDYLFNVCKMCDEIIDEEAAREDEDDSADMERCYRAEAIYEKIVCAHPDIHKRLYKDQ